MSQAAIDRGLFRSTNMKKYISQVQKNQSTSQDDLFVKPDKNKVIGMSHGTYDKLNEKGYAPEETILNYGDILIGKVSPIQPVGNSDKIYKDNSESYKSHVPGTVDKVWYGLQNYEGYGMIKTRVRSMRIPHIGDKMCLRDNAEVLTEKGWINIKNITMQHKIAILKDNSYIAYENPIDVYKFKYNGDMYKLTSQLVDLDVTMDHELYVRRKINSNFELIAAKNIVGKKVWFNKSCINNNPDIEFMNIPYNNTIYKYDMDYFLELLGKRLNNKEICDHIYVNKYLKNINKLPEFVFNLSQRQSEILLNNLLDNKQTNISHKLQNDIMKLIIHSGYGFIKNNNKIELISLTQTNNNKYINEEVYEYNGDVYCLEVSSHVFMMRLNNKNVWIGNCSKHGQKGTIGITLPASDMPFAENGVQLDLVMNANALKF